MATTEMQTSERSSPAKVETFVLTDDGVFPNNARLPLLVYHGVLIGETAEQIAQARTLFGRNHWSGCWVDGIYEYHHYHSTAHEVLAVCGGRAEVQFGGKRGITVAVTAGDVVVVPAGVAHKNLESSKYFTVVGAYPKGQHYDMCYGEEGERPTADENIARVPLPQADPLQGPNGPLMRHWTG